jgi:hypothetical protein
MHMFVIQLMAFANLVRIYRPRAVTKWINRRWLPVRYRGKSQLVRSYGDSPNTNPNGNSSNA